MSKHDFVFGLHATQSLIEKDPSRFIELFVMKGRNDDRVQPIINLAHKNRIPVQFVHRKTLDEKTQGEQHQGILALVRPAKALDETDLDTIIESSPQPFLLILDNVTDPHNLGACLRTCDAAGVDAVIVTKDKSAKLTATTRKVACGAAETVPLIQVTNLARTMSHIQQQGVWIVGTAGEATQDVYQAKLNGPMALVMGAEGTGMRRLTREKCDELISIPMAGSVSSLNVSVATGICLFEMVRQRRQ